MSPEDAAHGRAASLAFSYGPQSSTTLSNAIQDPTWSDISKLITDHDVEQMKAQGLDLRDYDQVSKLAHKIYYYLAYKIMPLGNPWSDDDIATYNNWLIAGMPRDAAHRAQIAAARSAAIASAGTRVRKDITDLTDDETKQIKAAFQWLMDQDPKTPEEYDPDAICYFSLAGKHWYPAPTYCQHHIYGYLPWHRWQMLDFENALRMAPGCEDVTLPYWDIETGHFPALFREEPFKSYTFPIDIYPSYHEPPVEVGKKGSSTSRFSDLKNSENINVCIANARTAPKFNEYNGITGYEYDTSQHIMRAHDLGHNGSGETMANQDVAAFDPMFWFFHANWDRLWWEWQESRSATDLAGFKKTLAEDDDQRWLTDPQMGISDPFGRHNTDSIDSSALGVRYAAPASARPTPTRPIAMGPAWHDRGKGHSKKRAFSLTSRSLTQVSLRVKGINRIKIPGSFWVVLEVGGVEIGRDAFFQSTFSGKCENCVAQSRVDFDFVFDRSHLADPDGSPRTVEVHVINAITGKTMDFDEIGNPTINIRMIH